METTLTKKMPLGLLLQIPAFIISFLGALNLIKDVVISFTNFDWLSVPKFVGFQNYTSVFSSGYRVVIQNTIAYMVIVLIFCFVGAILSALFISKLKITFGVVSCALATMFSFSALFVTFPMYVYGDKYYNYVNSIDMTLGLAESPINWFKENGTSIYLIFATIAITAPLFIITYIFARKGKRLVGVIAALCAMPIAFAGTYSVSVNLFGYPMRDYKDWLPTVIKFEMLNNPAEMKALWMVGIFMYAIWCVAAFVLVFIASKIAKRIKISPTITKTVGYIFFVGMILNVLVFVVPNVVLSVNNSFKPLDELFLIPQSFSVQRPTISNYTDYFVEYIKNSDLFASFSNVRSILVFCLVVVIPSAIGFALLKRSKLKKWLCVVFSPWLAFSPLSNAYKNAQWYRLGEFVSGLGVVVVFLVTYYLTKIIQESSRKQTKIVISTICVLSTIIFTALVSINFGGSAPYQNNWTIINRNVCIGGQAKCGVAFAGDVLLCIFTLITAIVPVVSFLWVLCSSKIKKSEE